MKKKTEAEIASEKAAIAAQLTDLLKVGNGNAILNKLQAAAYVQSSTRFLEREIRAGRLKACKPSGKFVRIRLKDLEAFLESGATTNGGG
jgi:excisionase family DNA binding protein